MGGIRKGSITDLKISSHDVPFDVESMEGITVMVVKANIRIRLYEDKKLLLWSISSKYSEFFWFWFPSLFRGGCESIGIVLTFSTSCRWIISLISMANETSPLFVAVDLTFMSSSSVRSTLKLHHQVSHSTVVLYNTY